MTQAKLKIKKGDEVIVLTGRDKGTKGEVLQVMPTKNRVIVQGVNKVKKHQKPTQFAPGGIVEKELSIHVSNVALLDPKAGTPTRVGYKTLANGEKVRIARKSGEEFGVKPAKKKIDVTKSASKKAEPEKEDAKKETKAKKAPAKKPAAKKTTKAKADKK